MEGQNELLSLLLEQREAQGGDASLELPSPKDSQEVESWEEEEDEVGGIGRWQGGIGTPNCCSRRGCLILH